MNTHNMKLADIPFEAIKDGKKVIESRIYDEKRRVINLGDKIIFSKNDGSDSVTTIVTSLNIYPNFEKLFSAFDASKFGGESKNFLLNQISKFYSVQEQEKNGVIGIGIKLP